MSIAHIITDIDTMQGLALHYYNDITKWIDIADYNKLTYPYLLKDKSELIELYASGYLTVIRANSTTAVTIKKGWTFLTKTSIFIGGVAKTFEVTEDTLVPAGTATYYIPIHAVLPGTFGNAMEFMITEVGANTLLQSNIQFLAVFNEKIVTGGVDLDVLVTGDTIYIPENSTEAINDSRSSIIDYTYGEDFVLDEVGSLVFAVGGDIASVAGADNVRYAVETRLITELKSLMGHPEYGTELLDLIGSPNLANREKLMQVAIQRSLAQEDRIKDVVVNSITVTGTSIYVDIAYKLAIDSSMQSIIRSITGGGINGI